MKRDIDWYCAKNQQDQLMMSANDTESDKGREPIKAELQVFI